MKGAVRRRKRTGSFEAGSVKKWTSKRRRTPRLCSRLRRNGFDRSPARQALDEPTCRRLTTTFVVSMMTCVVDIEPERMNEKIGEAEQAVMETLWSSTEALTAIEVAQRAGPERNWSESTVKTMLSRLAAKGVVMHVARGRAFFYQAAVRREAWAAVESRRFLNRLFDGRVAPLVAQLAKSDELSAEDISDLEALLAKLRE